MSNYKPLAEIMRPTSLNDFIGQETTHFAGNVQFPVGLSNEEVNSYALKVIRWW